jgi:hypothetical protein
MEVLGSLFANSHQECQSMAIDPVLHPCNPLDTLCIAARPAQSTLRPVPKASCAKQRSSRALDPVLKHQGNGLEHPCAVGLAKGPLPGRTRAHLPETIHGVEQRTVILADVTEPDAVNVDSHATKASPLRT